MIKKFTESLQNVTSERVLYERENITGEEFMALLEGKSVEEVFGTSEEPATEETVAEKSIAEEASTEETVAKNIPEEIAEENSEVETPDATNSESSDQTEENE